MDAKILDRIYGYVCARRGLYHSNAAYVLGKNPTTLETPKAGEPDNRIPIPLAKQTVDDMVGYAGRGITVSFLPVTNEPTEAEIANAKAYEAIASEWMDYNSDSLDTEEIYREALSQGKAYQVWWASASTDPGFPLRPEYKMVSGDSVFVKWSNDIKPVKEYAVRFWNDGDGLNADDKYIYATVYYPGIAEAWRGEGSKWEQLTDQTIEHPYNTVPVIEYAANKMKTPIFEAEKYLIDALDKLVGKSLNEVDRFNALVLLLPSLATPEMKAKLSEMRVLDDLARFEHWPEFLGKNLDGVTEFYKWMQEFIEKSYRKSIKVPDMTDATFGGSDESGVSRAFKMLGMEFVASGVEAYFTKGLYEKKGLFDDVIAAGTSGIDTQAVTIEARMKRNLPVAEMDKLQIATMMKALGLSDEAILNVLPATVIADVDKELARMKEAAEERVSLFTPQTAQADDA